MTGSAQTVQIRSFRVCFRLERSIHRIDRWRIPLPFGLPLRAVGYALIAFVVLGVASRLPVVGTLLGLLPAPVRLIALPGAVGYGLTRWEVDGRSAHNAALAWFRLRIAPARLVAFRPAPEPGWAALDSITVGGDGRGARLRPAEIVGPARVILRYPTHVRERRGALLLEGRPGPPSWRGTQLLLRSGQRTVVR